MKINCFGITVTCPDCGEEHAYVAQKVTDTVYADGGADRHVDVEMDCGQWVRVRKYYSPPEVKIERLGRCGEV